MSDLDGRIVIAGAGSIGCYVGGCLGLSGKPVTFLARPRLAESLAQVGLRVSDLDGLDRHLAPVNLVATDDAETALRDAAMVLVCVKSRDTAAMAATVERHTPSGTPIVSLQNGVENAARIKAAVAHARPVISGMVAFNVVMNDGGQPVHAHRATDGDICIDEQLPTLATTLDVEGMHAHTEKDMRAIQWGKLVLNLNNALVALSDLPMQKELGDRGWRRLLAQQMDEALAVIDAADIKPARLAGVSPGFLPTILRLPNWLFTRVARRMLAIDPQARSSMWEDLSRGRPTEIDEFQGAIIRLAAATSGLPTPLSKRIVAAINRAEAAGSGPPGLKPADLAT